MDGIPTPVKPCFAWYIYILLWPFEVSHRGKLVLYITRIIRPAAKHRFWGLKVGILFQELALDLPLNIMNSKRTHKCQMSHNHKDMISACFHRTVTARNRVNCRSLAYPSETWTQGRNTDWQEDQTKYNGWYCQYCPWMINEISDKIHGPFILTHYQSPIELECRILTQVFISSRST